MKKQNGITLIALVITIIVLLVLAGVSISLVLGNNGVLTQSKNAVENHQTASAEEEISMAWASCESDYWSAWANNSSISKSDFFEGKNGNKGIVEYLSKLGTASELVYNENGTSTIKYKSKTSTKTEPVLFEIDSGGKVSLMNSQSQPNIEDEQEGNSDESNIESLTGKCFVFDTSTPFVSECTGWSVSGVLLLEPSPTSHFYEFDHIWVGLVEGRLYFTCSRGVDTWEEILARWGRLL